MNAANAALIYDVILLLVFAVTAVRAWQAGFLATLARLAGKVLGIVGGVWGSQRLAPIFYDQYLSLQIAAQVEKALAQSGGDLAAALERMSFLPESLRASLAAAVTDGAELLPQQIVAAMEPVLLPLIQLVVAVVLCVVIAWVFRLVVGLLRQVNSIPLVGNLNSMLGLLMGLFTGCINCLLVVVVLWFLIAITAGRVDFLTQGVLNRSVGYTLLSGFNPFVVHY